MIRHCLWLGVLLAAVWAVRAEGPDDRYVRIYYLIQEADQLNERGSIRPAVNKYMEARHALEGLKLAYPDWNEKVVNYRLNYITSRLDPLTQQLPPVPPGEAPPAAAVAEATNNAAFFSATNLARALQDEVARLTAQNALLEAKLKEAFSVQPPALDPREFAKAEQRIKELEKERDLIKVTLDQEKSRGEEATKKLAYMVDPSVMGKERDILADVQRKLVQQTQLAENVQKENASLKQDNEMLRSQTSQLQLQTAALSQEVAALKERPAAPAPAATPPDLVASFRTLTRDGAPIAPDDIVAALQASNLALRTEQVLVESRLADLAKEVVISKAPRNRGLERELEQARAAMRELEEERATLKKKLDRVSRELVRRGGNPTALSSAEIESQLDGARARLSVLEARAVPYMPEELALFKQRELDVAAASAAPAAPAAPRPRNGALPTGTGPLFLEAERAVNAGRYAEAEQKYLDILRQDPDNVRTLASLAAVQMDLDKLAEAETNVLRGLALDAQEPACLYLLGNLKFRQENFDAALDALSRSAQASPDKPQTQFYLGKVLIAKGQRQAAEAALRRAIQLKPGWAEAHYLLAVVYATQQPPFKELAQWHYQKATSGGAPRSQELEQVMGTHRAAQAAP